MLVMTESDLYLKLQEISDNIKKNKYNDRELIEQLAIYNFIKHDLLGE